MRTALYRQFVMLVRPDMEPADDDEHAGLGEKLKPVVTDYVMEAIARELGHAYFEVPVIFLTVTCETERIDDLPFAEDCAPDGCAQCLAGRDWAKTFLMEHPGRHIIVGLATITAPAPL